MNKTFATYLSELPAVSSLGAGDKVPLLESGEVKYVDGGDIGGGGGGGITELTGDVTASGTGSVAATIANSAVTNAKVATGIDAVKIADGSVTNAEFQYLGSVTSDIQAQLNAKQATDATLTAFAALTITSNSITIGTGADAFSQTAFVANTFPARASTGALEQKTISDFGLSLVDDADASTARTTLGLGTLATQSGTFSGTSSGTNTGDQTITNSSDATSHTVTLSASGGSVQFVEGSGVTLATTGSGSAGVVTISSTSTSATEYTTAQTHTSLSVPSWAVSVDVFVVAGGGGGGSGRRGAAGEVRAGGGGGAAGWSSFTSVSIAALGSPANLYVTVGAGGTAGASRSTNNTNGADGGAGGNSYVSTTASASTSFVQAVGGGGGGGGSTGAGAAGAVGTGGGMLSSGAGAASSASGAVGNASTTNAYISGGGSGGGITTGNAASAGGAAGICYAQQYALVSGGAINTAGTAPTLVAGRHYGQGGSGGGSSTSGNAGAGGDGLRGGGAGGGGGSVNDTGNSGAGGVGGIGYVQVIFS